MECSTAPPDQRRRLFSLEIRTRYYPLILLGLFTLLGGFHPAYVLGVAVGYGYGLGKLDRVKVGQATLTSWEVGGCLENFTRRQGWVEGHAASRSGAWLPKHAGNSGSAGG